MCTKKDDTEEQEQEKILFDKVKNRLLQVCESNPNSKEYQRFKKNLEKASSFSDLII